MIYHSAPLDVLHLLVLGLTPAAETLSLDAQIPGLVERTVAEVGR